MADKIVSGGPPPADTSSYPPGSVWWQIKQMGADVSGRTFEATVWSPQVVNHIDWGDGPETANSDPAFDTPPAADGKLGITTVDHTYTGRPGTIYRVQLTTGGVRLRANVAAGEPAIIDDVTRDGIERPPTETQGDVFAERGRMATSIRKQMNVPGSVYKGGMVN